MLLPLIRAPRALVLLGLTVACAEGAPGSPFAGDGGSSGNTATATAGWSAGVPGSGAAATGGRGDAAAASGAGSTVVAGASGASSAGATAGSGAAGEAGNAAYGGEALPRFSFFVTSYAAMRALSGSDDGFGGDLRFGKADGLSGADEICRQVAERSLKGSGVKGWRAFLSVTKDATGNPVHAIDRIGEGPWYDRIGRLVAANKADLAQTRPAGADPAIIQDLPNEDGVPNHAPNGEELDNHDILTGTGSDGRLYGSDWSATCHDWTSSVGPDGKPRVGHSWPRMGSEGRADSWMSALDEAGCAAGASLVEMGPPDPSHPSVGSGGGYGGIYCFALTP